MTITIDQSWYDSKWPNTSGEIVLVDWTSGSPSEVIWEMIRETAETKTWLFLTDRPRYLVPNFPPEWKDLSHYQGGIPRNVWVGLSWHDPTTRHELSELRRISARRLFVVFGDRAGDFWQGGVELESWRCQNCGLRGEEPRPRDCPNVNLCGKDTIGPQIHWLIPVTPITEEQLQAVRDLGVKVWPNRPTD